MQQLRFFKTRSTLKVSPAIPLVVKIGTSFNHTNPVFRKSQTFRVAINLEMEVIFSNTEGSSLLIQTVQSIFFHWIGDEDFDRNFTQHIDTIQYVDHITRQISRHSFPSSCSDKTPNVCAAEMDKKTLFY